MLVNVTAKDKLSCPLRFLCNVEADRSCEKLFDPYFFKAYLSDQLCNGLWWIKFPHRVGEVTVGGFVAGQSCTNQGNQPIKVK